MEVTFVMTPEEWGKPIDVAEEWIHFVDDNVVASKLSTANSVGLRLMLNELRVTTRHRS